MNTISIMKSLRDWFLKQYAKALGSAQNKVWWNAHLAREADAKWKKLLDDATATFPAPYLELFGPVLENEVTHLRMSETASPTGLSSVFLFKITVQLLKNLIPLTNIVGVQPLRGPVGLVYVMKLVSKQEEPTQAPGSGFDSPPAQVMRLEVTKDAVEAKTRKFQAKYHSETAQDLASQHGVSFENEIIHAIADELASEIFSEVLDDLMKMGKDQMFVTEAPNAEQVYVSDTHTMVSINVNQAASSIAFNTRRGAGNFIVVSPLTLTILQSARKSVFVAAPKDYVEYGTHSTLMYVGTLNGSIKVYMTIQPKFEKMILVGYKGGISECDTGYVYSPYVPVMSGGPVIDPVTFQSHIVTMTRYGKTTFEKAQTHLSVSKAYYATVDVSAAFSPMDFPVESKQSPVDTDPNASENEVQITKE